MFPSAGLRTGAHRMGRRQGVQVNMKFLFYEELIQIFYFWPAEAG